MIKQPTGFTRLTGMQILHNHQTLVATVRDLNMMSKMTPKDAAAVENVDVKEKRSSDGVLHLMNPVASGDNMATGLNSAHKLKDEPPLLPPLVPCCEGRELQINEDLVRTGLSAISVKHDHSVIQCLSMSQACERMQVSPGLIKHRNSFRSLHRPDLKRVPYLRRLSPDDLETLFRGYADLPSKTDLRHETTSKTPARLEERSKDVKHKEKIAPTTADDGNTGGPLHPIVETRSTCPSDVPAGMRLHGARARLYTSVLAGARAGDQNDGTLPNEEFDKRVPEDAAMADNDVLLNEELQILLPPQVTALSPSSTTADSSGTTS